ncbi:MAG: glycosyltransferase [archaeon]
MKLSFLIAVHNEEKILAKSLRNLVNLPYEDYEIILGLDGCTDGSENIVKDFQRKYKNIKYSKLNLRQGKPEVIDHIVKLAGGDILIVNDADWIFKVRNKKELEDFISVFKNPKIGGIAESFPLEWDREKVKKGNLGYKMIAYSGYFWFKYQREKFTSRGDGLIYLKKPTMFLTNIYRRELYKKNFSLGDDFERTKNIMDKGYKVVVFSNENIPRMIAVYNEVSLGDLFKQKLRTAVARDQLKWEQEISIKDYYLPVVWDIFIKSWKKSIKVGLIVSLWIVITLVGTVLSKFKKIDTREGWKLRMKR